MIADRTALLSSIGQLFDQPQPTATDGDPLPLLVDWALKRWTDEAGDADWPVDVATHRVAFGFRLVTSNGGTPTPLPLPELGRALNDASSISAARSRGGGGAFTRGHSGESKPGVVVVEGHDAYGARRSARGAEYLLPFEWFVRDDGLGAEVAAFAEDNPWVTEAISQRRSRPWPPGERLAPSFQSDMMAERVAFVGSLAGHFPDAARCHLVVDYTGLAGRQIDETAVGAYFSVERTSRENGRRVAIETGVAALTAELPEVVAALIGPIFRLFEWEINADYVRHFLTGGAR